MVPGTSRVLFHHHHCDSCPGQRIIQYSGAMDRHIENPFAVLASPLLLYYTQGIALKKPGLGDLWFLGFSSMFHFMPGFSSPAANFFYTCGYLLALAGFLGILFTGRAEKERLVSSEPLRRASGGTSSLFAAFFYNPHIVCRHLTFMVLELPFNTAGLRKANSESFKKTASLICLRSSANAKKRQPHDAPASCGCLPLEKLLDRGPCEIRPSLLCFQRHNRSKQLFQPLQLITQVRRGQLRLNSGHHGL